MPKKKNKKRRKIKYNRILLLIAIIVIIGFFIYQFLKLNITNIYIHGNNLLSDQYIIEHAKIDNYPSTFINYSKKIENILKKETLIKKVKIKKTFFTKVHIYIEEEKALFYNKNTNETILSSNKHTEETFEVPTLINYVPDQIYQIFIKKIEEINYEVIKRMSEIEYKPDEADDKKFLIYMKDGNYVYLTLNKFSNINSYIEIIKDSKFTGKKGILYLDSGNHFQIIEE